MQENEVILVDKIPTEQFCIIVEEAIKYAMISSAFTINRMAVADLQQRIFNIAKGKIAEGLFKYFANEKKLDIDFESCATPFYQADKKDFIWKELAWDIKNNFIYHDNNALENYTSLPALVPNRSVYDQWQKKDQLQFTKTKGNAFLFTFLKLNDKQNTTPFFTLQLLDHQKDLLERAYNKYQGKAQNDVPFSANTFFDHLAFSSENYTIHEQPILAITGFATSAAFNLFRNISPSSTTVFDDFQKEWITKNSRNSTYSFLDGILYGKIENAGVPVAWLPAFQSLL